MRAHGSNEQQQGTEYTAAMSTNREWKRAAVEAKLVHKKVQICKKAGICLKAYTFALLQAGGFDFRREFH
eukprot:1149890-Pelagomonas_calceolata.AAC.3